MLNHLALTQNDWERNDKNASLNSLLFCNIWGIPSKFRLSLFESILRHMLVAIAQKKLFATKFARSDQAFSRFFCENFFSQNSPSNFWDIDKEFCSTSIELEQRNPIKWRSVSASRCLCQIPPRRRTEPRRRTFFSFSQAFGTFYNKTTQHFYFAS